MFLKDHILDALEKVCWQDTSDNYKFHQIPPSRLQWIFAEKDKLSERYTTMWSVRTEPIENILQSHHWAQR